MKAVIKTILISGAIASVGPVTMAQVQNQGSFQGAAVGQPITTTPLLGKIACDGVGETKSIFGGASLTINFNDSDPTFTVEVTDASSGPSSDYTNICREQSLAYYQDIPEVKQAINKVKGLAIQRCESDRSMLRASYRNGEANCEPLSGNKCKEGKDERSLEDGRCPDGYPDVNADQTINEYASIKNLLLDYGYSDTVRLEGCMIKKDGYYESANETCSTEGEGARLIEVGLYSGKHLESITNSDGTYTHRYECIPYRRGGKLYVGAMAEGVQCLSATPILLLDQ